MDFLEQLRTSRIIPVVRVATADAALEVAGKCAGAGLHTIEFTATTAGWAEAVSVARVQWPHLVIGAGTVLTEADAEQATHAGAQFLVSPLPAPAVRASAQRSGLPFIEGGFTPAEIAAASARGPAKLFPAHLGGPEYLRSLLAVLPDAAVVPTGGIRLADVPRWLEAGAIAVGVGSDLTAGDDVAGRVEQTLAAMDTA